MEVTPVVEEEEEMVAVVADTAATEGRGKDVVAACIMVVVGADVATGMTSTTR